MNSYELFITLLLGTMLTFTTFIDMRINKIPNWVVVVILMLQSVKAILLSYDADNIASFYYGVAIRIVTVFLINLFLYIFFSIGALGAGDLKLLAAVAIGFDKPLIYVLVTFVYAFLLSLIQLIRNKIFISRIKHLVLYLKDIFTNEGLYRYIPDTISTQEKMRYSIHLSLPMLVAFATCEGRMIIAITRGF